MRRETLSLLSALLLATSGCIGAADEPAGEPLEASGADPPPKTPVAEEQERAADAEPSTSPAPRNETAEERPPAEAPPSEPQATPPPPPPSEPLTPPDYAAQHEGWVEADPEGFVADHAFPVAIGAKNATVRAEVVGSYPVLGRLPVETANLTLEVFDPNGNLVGSDRRDLGSDRASVRVELPAPLSGDYVARVSVRGWSDGASAGDRYLAVIFVDY